MACGVLGAAVVQAVVVRAGVLDGQRPLLVVDLVALLRQLRAILEPLTRRSGRMRSERVSAGRDALRG